MSNFHSAMLAQDAISSLMTDLGSLSRPLVTTVFEKEALHILADAVIRLAMLHCDADEFYADAEIIDDGV